MTFQQALDALVGQRRAAAFNRRRGQQSTLRARPNFRQSVSKKHFGVSGVSGGSVGTMFYLLRKGPKTAQSQQNGRKIQAWKPWQGGPRPAACLFRRNTVEFGRPRLGARSFLKSARFGNTSAWLSHIGGL
jgi:hypothetical protein